MTRVVVRPRIKIVLLFIASDALVLLGLTLLSKNQAVADRRWLGVAVGVLLALIGVVGAFRALRQAVVIDQSGLRVRRFLAQDRMLTWADVRSIGSDKIFLRGNRPFYAPVLQVEGIGRLAAAELGSHAQEEAERNAEQLRGLQRGAQSQLPQVVGQ